MVEINDMLAPSYEEQILAILDFFDTSKTLNSTGTEGAKALAEAQLGNHTRFFSVLSTYAKGLPDDHIYVSEITNFIDNYISQSIKMDQYGYQRDAATGFVVFSSVGAPVLSEASITEFYGKIGSPGLDFRKNLATIGLVISGYLNATNVASQGKSFGTFQRLAFSVHSGMAKLQFYELLRSRTPVLTETLTHLDARTGEIETRINAQEDKLRTTEEGISTLQVRIENNSNAIQETNKKLEIAPKAVEDIKNNFTRMLDDTAKLYSDKYEQSTDNAEAFLNSIRSSANFDSLKIHWIDRAKSSRWSFFISAAILLILLVFIPCAAIYENAIVVDFLQRFANAATINLGENPNAVALAVTTVSRLVIITIPLALYFWLIRLVVRFNMRSMLLMDDANQRATMLETYYRMIEKSAATVEDRALVLQALLRPPPGHGADSVDPPNFTEVIDRAMGKA